MKKFHAIAFAAAAAFAAAPAFADVAGEITIAQTHAGLAGKATTLDMVHMHLHHAVNCLVGAGGTGFDAGNANPCAKAGAGAIPDSTDAAQKAKLQAACNDGTGRHRRHRPRRRPERRHRHRRRHWRREIAQKTAPF